MPAFTLAVAVLTLLVLLCLALSGPDTHQLDEMAVQLEHNRDFGIRQELLWQTSLAWKELFLGPDDPEVAHALENLAAYYNHLGDFNKVEQLLTRSISIKEKIYRTGHLMSSLESEAYIDLVDSMSSLAAFYVHRNQYHDAARILRSEFKVLKSYRQQYSFQLRTYIPLLVETARHVTPYELRGVKGAFNTDSALNELAQGMNYFQARRDKSEERTNEVATWHLQEFYKVCSEFYLMLNRYKDAEQTFTKGMLVASQSHPLFGTKYEDLLELAVIHQAQGEIAKQESCYKTVLSDGECGSDGNPLTGFVALRDYASLQKDLGRESEANNLLKQASDIKETLKK